MDVAGYTPASQSQATEMPFKTPRKSLKAMETIDSSTSSTEEYDQAIMDQDTENFIQEETQNWLAQHGPKLFALEASKFLAAEAKANARKKALMQRR